MRNPERLNNFYNEVSRLHKTYLPNWRAGQLWMNFLWWLQNNKKIDPFFPEEDKMIELFKEFCSEEGER